MPVRKKLSCHIPHISRIYVQNNSPTPKQSLAVTRTPRLEDPGGCVRARYIGPWGHARIMNRHADVCRERNCDS